MLAENFEEFAKVVLKNAPKNCQLTAPQIQKEIANCYAKETAKLLMEDLGGEYLQFLLMNLVMCSKMNNQLFVCGMWTKGKGS